MNRNLSKGIHEILPKIPPHCTVEQYAKIFSEKNRQSENQQLLADRVIKQSELIIDATRSKTDQCRFETDHRIKERIQNIQFLSDEIANRKREATIEEDTVKIYCKRIINAIKFIKEIQSKNDKQRKLLKEDDDAVKLINDPVDRELNRENSLLKCNQDKLEKTLLRLIEQARLLRAIIFALDSELLRKSTSLEIDKNNLDLKTNFETLKLKKAQSNGENPKAVTQSEWETLTEDLIRNASNEIASSLQLRSYTDITLNCSIEEIEKQIDCTSDEFAKRIDDTHYAKKILEGIQSQTQQKINDILKNISELRTELDAKEKYLILCKNRMENRTLRPGTELCKDRVQDSLFVEMQTLQQTIEHLNQMIDQSMITQRHLLHTKVLQDEEMNRLIHRLQIDQVDCMTIRDAIEFTPF